MKISLKTALVAFVCIGLLSSCGDETMIEDDVNGSVTEEGLTPVSLTTSTTGQYWYDRGQEVMQSSTHEGEQYVVNWIADYLNGKKLEKKHYLLPDVPESYTWIDVPQSPNYGVDHCNTSAILFSSEECLSVIQVGYKKCLHSSQRQNDWATCMTSYVPNYGVNICKDHYGYDLDNLINQSAVHSCVEKIRVGYKNCFNKDDVRGWDSCMEPYYNPFVPLSRILGS